MAKLDADPEGGMAFDPRFLRRVTRGMRPHQVRLQGGDASSDSFCYPLVTYVARVWPWAALLLLGAVHGLNPGMGWLFAVALGLQERDRRAVWRALLPLAAGHALAIAAAIAVAAVLGLALPAGGLRWLVAATLLVFGLLRLRRHRHPRGMGMRVGAGELTLWSFLMASAHGAGLMVLPFVSGGDRLNHSDARATAPAAWPRHTPRPWRASLHGAAAGLLSTVAHTGGYLLVLVLTATLVYERLGLRLLRTAWINLDLIWSIALTGTAVLTVLT